MMDSACHAWRSAARTHVRRLQVLQSKCRRLATCPPKSLRLVTCPHWYLRNRQIQEDLGVPLFSDHIRALIESFDWKLADVAKPLVRQIGRYLCWSRADSVVWRESQGRQGTAGQSKPSLAIAKLTKRNAFGAVQPSALRLSWLRFFHDFSSVVRQMPGYSMQSRGTARRLHLCVWQTSHTSSLRLSQSASEHRQPTNKILSLPFLVQGNLESSLWQDQSRHSAWLQNR